MLKTKTELHFLSCCFPERLKGVGASSEGQGANLTTVLPPGVIRCTHQGSVEDSAQRYTLLRHTGETHSGFKMSACVCMGFLKRIMN